jgi:Protein of unknown function (DUF2283)
MKSIYFESDDILQIRVSDKPIMREISQGWNTNISYAEDGSIVEIVLLDAKVKICCRWNTEKQHELRSRLVHLPGLRQLSRSASNAF